MPINNRNRHSLLTPRNIWVTLLSLLVIGALVMGVRHYGQPRQTSLPGSPTATESTAQKKVEAQQKKDFNDAESSAPTPTNPAPPATPSTPQSFDMAISQDASGLVVQAKAAGVSSGSCKLVASKGSTAITQTADVLFQPEFSTCAGFTVPSNQLVAGEWNVQLTITPPTGEALNQQRSFTVK